MYITRKHLSRRTLLRGIRRSLATQSLPIIIVTSSEDPRHEFELLDAGADDYIRKPVVMEQLQARVRAVLRRSGVRLVGGAQEAKPPAPEPHKSTPSAGATAVIPQNATE